MGLLQFIRETVPHVVLSLSVEALHGLIQHLPVKLRCEDSAVGGDCALDLAVLAPREQIEVLRDCLDEV